MKLCDFTWVPSKVADWLIHNLEEKGIPGENSSQVLLTLLYPYFFPSVPLSTEQFNEESNQKASQFEFDDSVDSDADFPASTTKFCTVTKVKYLKNESKKHLKPLGNEFRDKYKRIGLDYLETVSDKTEELELLIEKLFVRLESSIKEDENNSNSNNCQGSSLIINDYSVRQPVLVDASNNGLIENNEYIKEEVVNINHMNTNYEKSHLLESSVHKPELLGIMNTSESAEAKEEWELMYNFMPNEKVSPEHVGHRLFERAGNEENDSKNLHLNIEPWEHTIAFKNEEKRISIENRSNNGLNSGLCSYLPPVSSVWKTDSENNHGYNLFEEKASLFADDIDNERNYINNENRNIGTEMKKPLDPVGSSRNYKKSLPNIDTYIKNDFNDSLFQLKIDIWKNNQESDTLNDSGFDSLGKLTSGLEDIAHSSSFSKIPKGPSGPHATLNHTETSGFSSVVPHRDDYIKMDSSRKTGGSPRQRNRKSIEKENLLTSPRTHFKPIKQDNHGENNDEYDKCDELQSICTATTEFKASEGLFHRTGSGNLIIENENNRGTPSKYMVFKDSNKSFPSPDVTDHSPVTANDNTTSSFLPKFKISNNEKFCQTDDNTSYASLPNPLSHSSDIWQPTLTDDIKKLWNKGICNTQKEIWEFDSPSLPFSSLDNEWNKDAGSCFDSNVDGPDILTKIRLLWQTAYKESDHSSREQSIDKASVSDYISFPGLWNMDDEVGHSQMSEPDWTKVKEEPKKRSLIDYDEELEKARWAKWSEAKDFVPKSVPKDEEYGKDEKESDLLEDLSNLEPNWNLNEGFEWDPGMLEDDDQKESDRDMLYYEYNGQTVAIPVEYLEDDCYEEMFGSTDSSIGGSLPDLPKGPVDDTKKLFKLKRKNGKVSHSRRPCTFFLEGNCLRTDCKFSHDLSSITCRFWEEDSCFKAETCPFLHGYPRKRNLSEGDQSESMNLHSNLKKEGKRSSKARAIPKSGKKPISPFEISSEADFPSLGSSFDSKTNSCEELSKVTFSKSASLGKKKKFINIPKHFLKEIEVKRDGNVKGSRRKKAKDSKRRSHNPSEFLMKSSTKESFKQNFSQHEDGTVSDY